MKKSIATMGYLLKLTLLSAVFFIFMIIGFCTFLRPKSSELERRKLIEFPKPSFQTVWDGKFFSDVSKWYSDTFPFREPMIAMKSEIEEFYGIRNTAIYGDTGQVADNIPTNDNEEAPILSDISDIDDNSTENSSNITKKPELSEKTETEENITQKNVAENELNGSTGKLSDNSIDNDTNKNTEIKKVDDVALAKKKDGTLKIKPEVAGTIYVAENRGFTLYYFYKKGADIYASMLNTVAKKLNTDRVYDIVVPNSFGVNLDEKIQAFMRTSNQGDAINYIYNKLSKTIKTVKTYKTLRKHNSEYLYFKTDHHWTALGAYYVYKNFCEVKGVKPHSLQQFKKKEFKNFLGTFYAFSNQSKALKNNKDTVIAYIPMGTNTEKITPVEGKPYIHNIISDANKFSEANKYLTFIGGDRPLTEIKNPKINDESACIIVKESYGNAFVPFLVDHYQYVYVLDYRYYKGNATKLFRKHKNTDLIFLNNTAATSIEKSKMMLGMFKNWK